MKAVNILLADDHEVVRRGVRAILEAQRGWKISGEATNGHEAVQMAKELKPTVVVMDISMPELNGLEATRQLLKAIPKAEVLILTMHESEHIAREVFAAGARGYILKSEAACNLVAAVKALCEHKLFFPSIVSEMLMEAYLRNPSRSGKSKQAGSYLTAREREIVQLLAEGKTNKEVAKWLGISAKTAETHRGNLMRKLNLRSVSDLVRYAVRNKIVEA